jgi:hypothetical protein
MERLLQYVWQHKILPLHQLKTTKGLPVDVIDPGYRNTDAGPDFFNAKVRIDGTLWAGNVEVHERSSQWYEHGHDKDAAYNSVVLHVVTTVDTEVHNQRGDILPQIQLDVPDNILQNFLTLEGDEKNPPCHNIVTSLSPLMIHSWMGALQTERLEQKAGHISLLLKRFSGDWEQTYFSTLARNFGFGINADGFEAWSESLPLADAAKIRDDQFRIEALFLGQAGLLNEEIMPEQTRQKATQDIYFLRLQKEYAYQAHMFGLKPIDYKLWRFLRLRPQNFPYIRVVQLASLYCSEHAGFSNIIEAKNIQDIYRIFDTQTSPYWESHYVFGNLSEPKRKRITHSTIDLIIINTVVPLLFCYGKKMGNEQDCQRATAFLDLLKPELNHITQAWSDCGIQFHSAADSQAIIQLQRNYCDRHECLRCRFGYEYLKSSPWPVIKEP